MGPTSQTYPQEELKLINLFDNFTPFVPDTPVLKAIDYNNQALF